MVKIETKIHWLEIDGKMRPLWEPSEQPQKTGSPFEPYKLPSGGEGIEQELIEEISSYQPGDTIPGPDDCLRCQTDKAYPTDKNGNCIDCNGGGKAPHKLTVVELMLLRDVVRSAWPNEPLFRIAHKDIEICEALGISEMNPYLCLGDTVCKYLE